MKALKTHCTSRGLAATVLLAGAVGLGCSDTSPQGDELAAPAERDATPVSETGLERTASERREERLEEWNVVAEPPEEGVDAP